MLDTSDIPLHWRRVRLVSIAPPDYPFWQCFTELIETIRDGLQRLGIAVDSTVNDLSTDAINIVFGAHLINAAFVDHLPTNIVIFNLEQLGGDLLKAWPHYARLLARFPVWDYSPRNIARCQAQMGHPHIHRVGIGYAPGLSRIEDSAVKPVDVLFYGCANDRRKAILDGLRQAGLTVQDLFKSFGADRDAAIADAKVVLNLHFYADSIHEIVRTSYLLANRKAVVTECGPETEIDDDLRSAMAAVPYDRLVETCVALVRDDTARQQLEQRGFEIFSKRDQALILASAIAATSPPLPRTINLGSGKSFQPDCFNIDINPLWRPDLLADISDRAWLGKAFISARFGLQRLMPGTFDEIIVRDVLEHIVPLTEFMTHCLALLRDGGIMTIHVPYDLSYGAWQDPTHVRAFNERSWLYYTDWHWYLGWTDARFDLKSMVMVVTPFGAETIGNGVPIEEVYRMPRAVDAMDVVLVKRSFTEQESQTLMRFIEGNRS